MIYLKSKCTIKVIGTIFSIFSIFMVFNPRLYAWEGVAILGDSLSTGAASHPNLAYDPQILWRVFLGEESLTPRSSDVPSAADFNSVSELPAPMRLWPNRRENDGASTWLWSHLIQAISKQALDTEEYSYGYLFGRALNIDAKKIWIAGDNGTRSEHAIRQADRVLVTGAHELPTNMIVFFTGNDLCAQTWELTTQPEIYGQGLYNGLKYLARHGRSAPNESTTIFIPAFLPISSLIHQESILKKEINFYGSVTTCAEARKRYFAQPDAVLGQQPKDDFMYNAFSQVMPPNPILLCPTVFAISPTDDSKSSRIANRVRAFRDEQQKVIERFNVEIAKGDTEVRMTAVYVPGTGDLVFEGEDVGGDCFHLSPRGHQKIARAIIERSKQLKK